MEIRDIFQIKHTADSAAGENRDGISKIIPRTKRFQIHRFMITALTDVHISMYLTEYGLPFISSYARHGNTPDEKRITDGLESIQKLYLI